MKKATDDQENLSTVLHQITHILGFSPNLYSYFIDPISENVLPNTFGFSPYFSSLICFRQKYDSKGNIITYLNVEPLTSRLRAYYNCPTLEGAYLEDDEDPQFISSHFERRVFMNEYMTANSIVEPVISEFTLALLEGTGWYKANYSMAEPFNWGRGEGCQFLEGSCLNQQGDPNYNEFCDPDIPIGCSFTAKEKAFCQPSNRTDSYVDNSPNYKGLPKGDCEDPDNIDYALISGETFGPLSRCFTGTLTYLGRSFYDHASFCFHTTCTKQSNGRFIITLQVGDYDILCTKAESISVPGYNGTLNCPDPDEFCARANPIFCEKGCSGRGKCVNNKCECPEGWGGPDCAERLVPCYFIGGEYYQGDCDGCSDAFYREECVYDSNDILYYPTFKAQDGDEASYVTDCKRVVDQSLKFFPGEIYGSRSKCFIGSLREESSVACVAGAICLEANCTRVDDGFKLSVKIGEEKITCTRKGPVFIHGYRGSLNCPDPNEFCAPKKNTFRIDY